MKIHDLKCHTEYFMKVVTGEKKFEIRLNDRDFKKGDVLHLQNYNPIERKYEFGYCLASVDYIFNNDNVNNHLKFGVADGFCIMSITVIKSEY